MEDAARRQVQKTRYLRALERDPLLRASDGRIRLGDRSDQSGRIRVRGVAHERLGVGELDHATEIHHGDAALSREVARDGEVVRDEHGGHMKLGRQVM